MCRVCMLDALHSLSRLILQQYCCISNFQLEPWLKGVKIIKYVCQD